MINAVESQKELFVISDRRFLDTNWKLKLAQAEALSGWSMKTASLKPGIQGQKFQAL